MTRLPRMIFLAPLALVPFGCSGSGGGGSPPVTAEVTPAAATTLRGPAGSSLADLVLTIPAGAVGQPVTVSVAVGGTTETAGNAVAGPAAKFGPDGLTFSTPATLELPFDGNLVGGAALGDVRVQLRDDNTGAIVELVPDAVDTGSQTVQLEVPHFSTCWVTIPATTGSGEFDAFGTLDLSGPDTAVVGATLTVGDLGFLVPGVYTFVDEFTVFPGPPGNFDYIVVMNIFEAPGSSLSMVISVDGVDYDYTCTNVSASNSPCGALTIDPATRTVTFDDVIASPSGNSTGPLRMNGVLGWTEN